MRLRCYQIFNEAKKPSYEQDPTQPRKDCGYSCSHVGIIFMCLYFEFSRSSLVS